MSVAEPHQLNPDQTEAGSAKALILKVALKAPLHELFDYLPPPDCEDTPQPGQRVRVPFGRSQRVGVITAISTQSDIEPGRLKPATEILDSQPVLEPELVDLLNWSAAYYQHPPGDVFAAALPGPLRKGKPADGSHEVRWLITPQGREAIETGALKRAPVQLAVLDAIGSDAGGLNSTQLDDVHPRWQPAVRELITKNLISREQIKTEPLKASPDAGNSKAPDLNDAQQNAVDSINATGFAAWLLEGITGSGKTEVYLNLIGQQLEARRQCLVLVPEIGLTPQLVARFRERLPVPVGVLHSGLNDTERTHTWLGVKNGDIPVLIGTRSAIFTPMQTPGMIIIDEEHDASFKQQEGFRYSARDLALLRAQKLDIPVVLGSATPSFESLANVTAGRYQHLSLPERAGGAEPPSVNLIDLRSTPADDGLSPALVQVIKRHLEADSQVLIYLNRRGYAPVLFCSGCGASVECGRCDARMVVHQHSNKLVCHHCGHECRQPTECSECGSDLIPVGLGTERIEQRLTGLFPQHALVRLDRDTTRRKGALEERLDAIREGRARILLGTQMLTKGHDFPDVTLVAVIDADQGLFGTDFRSAERMAQNFIQVAGRAGRAERRGEVWIQTGYPEHPLLQTLIQSGYEGFANQALEERQAAGWPPFSHIALLRAESANRNELFSVLDLARSYADQINNRAGANNEVSVLGPATAPMERRAGRWRGQLLIQASGRRELQALLSSLRLSLAADKRAAKARWSIDVDPVELF